MAYKNLLQYRKEFLSNYEKSGGDKRIIKLMTEFKENEDGTREYTANANELFISMYKDLIKLMPKPPIEVRHEVDNNMVISLAIPRPSSHMIPDAIVVEADNAVPLPIYRANTNNDIEFNDDDANDASLEPTPCTHDDDVVNDKSIDSQLPSQHPEKEGSFNEK